MTSANFREYVWNLDSDNKAEYKRINRQLYHHTPTDTANNNGYGATLVYYNFCGLDPIELMNISEIATSKLNRDFNQKQWNGKVDTFYHHIAALPRINFVNQTADNQIDLGTISNYAQLEQIDFDQQEDEKIHIYLVNTDNKLGSFVRPIGTKMMDAIFVNKEAFVHYNSTPSPLITFLLGE